MKRICATILCLSLILAGCQNKVQNRKEEPIINLENANTDSESEIVEEENDDSVSSANDNYNESDGGEEKQEGLILLSLDKTWSTVETMELKKEAYEMPSYKAEVKPYKIAKNLTNVENIDQFSGFTKEQLNMLYENGFVVVPSTDTKMRYVYDSNEYLGVPNFITTDSVLHLYHQFYDKSLMGIESNYLYEDLDLMTKQLMDKSILLYGQLKDEELMKLQERNVIYFLVARMIMIQSPELNVNVKEELLDIAKQEYDLIEKAEGYTRSPFLEMDFDYSQFTVRGHYTRSEELGRFFKAMMWYGTAPYSFIDDKEYNYDNVLMALLISYTTFAESEKICDAELWSNIYLPTAQYVGLSDDINVFTMNSLRLSVYGDNEDPDIFNDEEYYDKLYEAVKALPEPKMKADLKFLDTPTEKQFRFMGQRYVLDGEILQTLIDSILRPIPSSLDVMGVLGSNTAENLLFEEIKPQNKWPEYEERYKELEEQVSEYTPAIWGQNLYNGWIWSIQDVLTEYDASSGMPFFMTTDAWKCKSLNAALGSYTELKHDTVLYGKQAVAEMGGPIDFAEQHYVEPNIELYQKLLYLTDDTIKVIKDIGVNDESLLDGANHYKELLELLINCSRKELSNELLTEDERRQLLWYGGKMESISKSFLDSITGDYDTFDLSDTLVTDISTNMSNYLSLGTGFFDYIYVVVPHDGKLYLTRGSVYSSYEFVSNKRLTDEEWWALHGVKISREEFGDYPEITEPSKDMPQKPFWAKKFKTEENNVEIKPLEVVWENLTE